MVKKYKVKKPIGFYGRRAIGEIVELTDEQARAIGDDYITPEPEPVTTGEASPAPAPVETQVSAEPAKEEAKVEGEAAVQPKRTRKPKK